MPIDEPTANIIICPRCGQVHRARKKICRGCGAGLRGKGYHAAARNEALYRRRKDDGLTFRELGVSHQRAHQIYRQQQARLESRG